MCGRLKEALRRKLEVLIEALEEQFGTAAEFSRAQGRHLPLGHAARAVDTAKLAGAGAGGGRCLQSRPRMVDRSRAARHSIRLCFALPPADIREGVARLAEIRHREYGVPQRSASSRASHPKTERTRPPARSLRSHRRDTLVASGPHLTAVSGLCPTAAKAGDRRKESNRQ